MNRLTFFLIFTFSLLIGSQKIMAIEGLYCEQSNLMRDLMIVEYWNDYLRQRLPVTYNHYLQGGYIIMPSARMGAEGEIGFGYSYVTPYISYNLRAQLLDRLEVSGNYRIFKGVEDPILSPMGFGDFSDKGANLKFCLFSPEDSHYKLPGVAFGMDDFLGTRAFKAYYIVLTKVFLEQNMEISLGYGTHRIRGFFGGATWFPFRCHESDYLKGLSFTLEYDATPYEDSDIEKHPDGRVKKTPLNIGVKYRLWDSIDLSLSYIRGDAFAFSISGYFNLGETKGIIPKVNDCLPYQAPVNTEEIGGCLRPEEAMVQDFVYAFAEHGLEIVEMWMTWDCRRTLRLKIYNLVYREECRMREQLEALLAALTPDNVDRVIVILEGLAFPIQEYRYDRNTLRLYQDGQIGRYQLEILSPLAEVSNFRLAQSTLLFKRTKPLWGVELLPKTHTLFGSAKGKFKYAVGLTLAMEGFLYYDIYYTLRLGYFVASNLYDISDVDRLNPSQVINVRSDIINYFKQKSITIDEAYMQKINNWGRGWYTRVSVGLFEQEYGGLAGECLYYPVYSSWAIGLEGAVLRKRNPEGIGFSDEVRKLEGFVPVYVPFFGSQYFLNLYYDWPGPGLEFKISIGKFLANDQGVRYEVSRYFPSGLRLTFWYTRTNGHDKINGETYYDKGVSFSMPLDIFYPQSSRTRWGYGMSAWLRDVGVKAYTGPELFYLIDDQRQ
jgi:hypothetical protein